MAFSITLRVSDRFPVGTSVGLYPELARINDHAPSGAALSTATVIAPGTLTFDGLSEGGRYVAYALVSGTHRYVRFNVSNEIPQPPQYGPFVDGQVPAWRSGAGRFEGIDPNRVLVYNEELDTYQSVDAAIVTAIERGITFLSVKVSDVYGERVPTALRAGLELRRPEPGVRVVGAPESYIGETATTGDTGVTDGESDSDDAGEEKLISMSRAGRSLEALCIYALTIPHTRHDLPNQIDELAQRIVGMQHRDEALLCHGGFRTGPTIATATAVTAATCGSGLLAAYKVWGSPREGFKVAAGQAADFLVRCYSENVNTVWDDAHGITPLDDPQPGFICDQVTVGDQLTTTCTTWNLDAAVFLKEWGDFVGGDAGQPYLDVAEAVRDALADHVLAGTGYDFVAQSTNIFSGRLIDAVNSALGPVTELHVQNLGPVTAPVAYPYELKLSPTLTDTDGIVTVTGAGTTGPAPTTTGTSGYLTITAEATLAVPADRRWQKVEDYVSAQWYLSSPHIWNDDARHRRGDVAGTASVGSDQLLHGINALWDLGYPLSDVMEAYEYWSDLPHSGQLTEADGVNVGLPAGEDGTGRPGSNVIFGAAYQGRWCWPGNFRMTGTISPYTTRQPRAYSPSYDTWKAGGFQAFRAAYYPDDFVGALPWAIKTVYVGATVDENFDTLWATPAAPATGYKRGGTGPGATAVTIMNLCRALRYLSS